MRYLYLYLHTVLELCIESLLVTLTTLAVANLKTGYPRQCMRKVASGNVRVSKLLRAYTIDLLTRAHST